MNCARCQQYRRLPGAGAAAAGSAGAALLGLPFAGIGALSAAELLVLVAVGLALLASLACIGRAKLRRRPLRGEVRRALAPLKVER